MQENQNNEPEYKKWTTIVSSIVAIFSLLLSAILGILNINLLQQNNSSKETVNKLESEIKTLELMLKKQETSVDLETRYLVISGIGLSEISQLRIADTPTSVVQNQVWQQMTSWLEKWGSGENITDANQESTRAHGVLLLSISNIGKQVAHEVVLEIKQKEFSTEGNYDEFLWELDTTHWQKSKIKLADLRPGQSVVIPLAHVLGTQTYFGSVIIPSQIKWFNTTLQKEESKTVSGIAPESEWILKGLTLKVAQ